MPCRICSEPTACAARRASIRSIRRRCARLGAALVRALRTGDARRCGSSSAATRASRASGSSASWRAAPRRRARRVTSAGVIPTPAVAYLTRDDGLRRRRRDLRVAQSRSRTTASRCSPAAARSSPRRSSARSRRSSPTAGWAVPAGGRRARRSARRRRRLPRSRPRCRCPTRERLGRLQASPSTAPTARRRPSRRGCSRSSASTSQRASATRPDGRNINLDCGSTHPEALARAVRRRAARRMGVAFDGDGDRAIFVDAQRRDRRRRRGAADVRAADEGEGPARRATRSSRR